MVKKNSHKHKQSRFVEKKTPRELYGPLFDAVQNECIFPDSKVFADCQLKGHLRPGRVVSDYLSSRDSHGFSLRDFVYEKFEVPEEKWGPHHNGQHSSRAIHEHARKLLRHSVMSAGNAHGSSMLEVPHPFLTAGGKEREQGYWSSYFVALALKELGDHQAVEHVVKNFNYLLKTYGVVPATNRTYSLSRSQPPVFGLLVNLLAESKGPAVYGKYQEALEIEYDYFMDRTANTKHVVKLEDGVVLNRYWDQKDQPRDECYREDIEFAQNEGSPEFYRELRSTAESGWGLSSRWLCSQWDPLTLRTTDILPVDLNCLMYHLEAALAQGYREQGNKVKQDELWTASQKRREAIDKYFFNENLNWYTDYDIRSKSFSNKKTLAGMFPFFLNIAGGTRINAVAPVFEAEFLSAAGAVTTLEKGQPWDAPFGVAPLQYVAAKGLEMYGKKDLAKQVASRWVDRSCLYFFKYGKFIDRFDVTIAVAAPPPPPATSENPEQSEEAPPSQPVGVPEEDIFPKRAECEEEGFGWAVSVLVLLS